MTDGRSATAIRLGDSMRAARLRSGRSLVEAAARVQRSAAWLSRIEHGLGDGVPLRAWLDLAESFGVELDVAVGGPPVQEKAAGHAAMADAVAAIAEGGGWVRRPGEGPYLEMERLEVRRAWHRACRVVVAIWDEVPEPAAAIAALDGRIADLRSTVAGRDAVSGVIVVRRDHHARRRLGPNRPGLGPRFAASGSRWIAALGRPDVTMPADVTMCWYDATRRRLIPMFLRFGDRRRPRRTHRGKVGRTVVVGR